MILLTTIHIQLQLVGAYTLILLITKYNVHGLRRDINRSQVARKKEAIAYFSIESAVALLISLFINLCVVSVFAKGFYGKGASDIGLINAGTYLGDRFGQHMVRAIDKNTFSYTLQYHDIIYYIHISCTLLYVNV